MDPDIKLCSQLCDLSYESSIDDNVINTFKNIGLNVKEAQFTQDGSSVSFCMMTQIGFSSLGEERKPS